MRGTRIESATKERGRRRFGIHSNHLLLLGGPDLQIPQKEISPRAIY